uniref:Uncharacterized protein n=1 Tax=Globisporangium ultimum (strain ATCC 200006 / CBS 805.95 / DAOM BR144) TaxID=431595 RepID=K3X4U3_GLOUD
MLSERRQPTSLRSFVQYKENFMRQIVHPDVLIGDLESDLVGVETLLDQWRNHMTPYARLEPDVVCVESILSAEENPIVVVYFKMHTRFSRETLDLLFLFVEARRPHLMERLVGQDIQFNGVTRVNFSTDSQITPYAILVNYVEALVKFVGSPVTSPR